MADYGEFNNNNYLPGLYNNDIDPALNSHPTLTQNRGTSPGNSFTFTSPTQCITLATHRPCIQTTSPISSLSAPGVGTSWQHSIPVTMPWVDGKSHVAQSVPGTVTPITTVFTGIPTQSQLEGHIPFSGPPRRPKRKSLQLPDEAPISKVYLCADQFANMKISQCEKHICGLPTDNGANTGIQFYNGGNCVMSRSDSEGWQRFRDVENRLDVELDEDLSMGAVSDSEEGPYLKVAKGVLEASSFTTSTILPRRVMEDITKPCMQIVLWKSPGEVIRDIATEELKPASSTDSSNTKNTDTNKMDTLDRSPLTSMDNIMDTAMYNPHPQIISSTSNRYSPIELLTPPASLSTLSSSLDTNKQPELDMFDSVDDDMQL